MARPPSPVDRGREPRVPSLDDKLQAEATEHAVQEGIKALKPLVDTDKRRLLRTLNKEEMTSLTVAIISGWIKMRAAQRADPLLEDSVADLFRDGPDAPLDGLLG